MDANKFILCLFLIFSNLNVLGQNKTLQLKIEVTNVQSHVGVILIAIYDSEETFLNEPLQYKVIPIAAEAELPISVQTVFEGLKAGQYAVSVYHDKNKNWELDRNWIGIPKEMFGFSNNAKAKFSPPTFDECSVDISQLQSKASNPEDANSLVIRLKNW
ncbi:MAG: DUF2141 domain-containing protein [Chitinophagales bacterium]